MPDILDEFDKTVIFDIDKTLANNKHREHYIIAPYLDQYDDFIPNWDAFHAECYKDTPIQPTIDINNLMYNAGYFIILLTGRTEKNREITKDWCYSNGVKFHSLLMRPNNARESDYIMKRKAIDKISNLPPIHCVFEDSSSAVEMWREKGYQCYQVDDTY